MIFDRGKEMRSRLASFFRIETNFDEVFWVGVIFVLLYAIQLFNDGSIH